MVGEVEIGSRDSVRLSTLEKVAAATGTRLVVDLRTPEEDADTGALMDSFLNLAAEDRQRVIRFAIMLSRCPRALVDGSLQAMGAFSA